MVKYTLFDKPLKVFGVPFFEETKKLQRIPDALMERLPRLGHLGRRCPGGLVSFKTNSTVFTVKVALKTLSVDIGMSIYACQSAHIMLGERSNARHLGVVNPPDYQTKVFEKTFHKSADMEQISIYFPRNEQLESIEVFLEDDALVAEPTPYRCKKPVVFYGSSITEGGCCCNVTNAYNAILSRWLDFECYNLGFSGNAKGDLSIADYISTLDMAAFVYDYDHNAPTVAHLADTHKPFFDRIRKAHPQLPVLMMTRPAERYSEDMKARREVVKATYTAAVESGDRNVYFIDGETLYGEADRNLCAVDNCHPNDLGFFRIASTIRPVLAEILENAE